MDAVYDIAEKRNIHASWHRYGVHHQNITPLSKVTNIVSSQKKPMKFF
jgi:hypothetical protein